MSNHADVITVGYGATPKGAREHLRLPDNVPSLPKTARGILALAARRHESSELAAPGVRAALELVGDRRFDIVVANDARALPVAFTAAQNSDSAVWADLHEWAPEERSHIRSWRLLVAPMMDYLCRKYLPRCAAITTVSNGIAELYASRYGVKPQIMRNSPAFVDLTPSPAPATTIRLVHSGLAAPGRQIETIIDAMDLLGTGFTLDLFLMPGNDGGRFLDQLQNRAAVNPTITFHDPVPAHTLPQTLNDYDVGVYWIPPYSTNARLALPNKFFDFIQARLALAIAPSPEMTKIVEQHGLGVVSDGFDLDSCAKSLTGLTQERVAEYKAASDLVAHRFSFDADAQVASSILESLLAR
ncbi:glycosyltransferase [Georgenia thermotolerans]|uniref:glycosyltransferase n=1 Tax=Georgenia thermotolerans TaxID=527326 RepID=UPI0020134443|nr:glycosyltransferase [Georgenia thermotolerans]